MIEFDNETLTVAGTVGKGSADRNDRAGFARVSQLAARSALTRRAAGLIVKMGFGTNSPIQPVLLTTRMFLLSLTNDDSGIREMSDWIHRTRTRLKLVPASSDDAERTPGQCWEEYMKESAAIWVEYDQCIKDTKWWDALGDFGCGLRYDMRALGAFTWWLDCVKITAIIK